MIPAALNSIYYIPSSNSAVADVLEELACWRFSQISIYLPVIVHVALSMLHIYYLPARWGQRVRAEVRLIAWAVGSSRQLIVSCLCATYHTVAGVSGCFCRLVCIGRRVKAQVFTKWDNGLHLLSMECYFSIIILMPSVTSTPMSHEQHWYVEFYINTRLFMYVHTCRWKITCKYT